LRAEINTQAFLFVARGLWSTLSLFDQQYVVPCCCELAYHECSKRPNALTALELSGGHPRRSPPLTTAPWIAPSWLRFPTRNVR